MVVISRPLPPRAVLTIAPFRNRGNHESTPQQTQTLSVSRVFSGISMDGILHVTGRRNRPGRKAQAPRIRHHFRASCQLVERCLSLKTGTGALSSKTFTTCLNHL
jgi:hypothetical protein